MNHIDALPYSYYIKRKFEDGYNEIFSCDEHYKLSVNDINITRKSIERLLRNNDFTVEEIAFYVGMLRAWLDIKKIITLSRQCVYENMGVSLLNL